MERIGAPSRKLSMSTPVLVYLLIIIIPTRISDGQETRSSITITAGAPPCEGRFYFTCVTESRRPSVRVVIQEPGIILPQELILFDLYRSSAYEVDQNVTDLGVIITTVTIKDVNQHRGWIFYCVQRYQLSTVRSDELTISQPAADCHISTAVPTITSFGYGATFEVGASTLSTTVVQASVEDNRTYVVVRGGIKESDGSNLTVSLGALTAIIVTIVIIAMLIVIAVTAIICIGFHSKHSKAHGHVPHGHKPEEDSAAQHVYEGIHLSEGKDEMVSANLDNVKSNPEDIEMRENPSYMALHPGLKGHVTVNLDHSYKGN